jgi:hypothetical protein
VFKRAKPENVAETRKRIYSSQAPQEIKRQGQVLATAHLYLTFDFNLDHEGHLILVIDFANEYRSTVTLQELDLNNLKPKQRLRQTYDGRGCEWVGLATVTIGESLPELGNLSLWDYHQQRGRLASNQGQTFNSQQRGQQWAVQVRYPNQTKTVYHLPQLLQILYDRKDIPPQALGQILRPIDEKVKLAQRALERLNQMQFNCGQPIPFDLQLRHPPRLTYFVQGSKRYNLDFGPKVNATGNAPDNTPTNAPANAPANVSGQRYYDEVWKGWKNRQLLQRPAIITIQVLYPASWATAMTRYQERLQLRFNEFGIALTEVAAPRPYDPKDQVNLKQVCQNLPEPDLVFAFVPTRGDRDFDEIANPYNTFKRTLLRDKIPSQMVTHKTMNQPGNDGRDQNVVLGILAKLGYLPWCLRSMPGTAQAFIGLDLGRKDQKTVGASAFVVNAQGQLIGWSNLSLQQGETFSDDSLRSILLDLFQDFEQVTKTPLRHMVIHRDGTVKSSELATFKSIETMLRPQGLEQLDVVELVKDNLVRGAIPDPQNPERWTNPQRGWGWQHAPDQAIVLTTGAKQAKIHQNASPQPLLVRRRHGTTDLLTLAEQVYWLSEMHIGSSQTVRLPITTYYADRIAEVALKGFLLPQRQQEHRLYFL